ncbi:MAG: peptide deformylase [Sandaracinaceae bacterium]|nr:peptide deformylase [Sandaracinaceae bacterium]
MTLRKIAQIGHPVLRQRAREVSPEELASDSMQAFIDDLVETMHDANGAGLAAIQIHEPIRVCALEVKDNPRYPYKPNIPLTILVNPVLTPIGDDTFENYEGCLSVPDLRGVVRRHAQIRVQALDRHGAPLDYVARGITAGTYQHECDHLDGVLFVDRVEDPTTLCTWKEFGRHREEGFKQTVAEVVERWGS